MRSRRHILDLLALRPEGLLAAVDDRLRRIEVVVAARIGIGLLALGEGVTRQLLLPPGLIEVIDGHRQGDQVGIAGELSEQRIRRRAGGAALAGEQLDDGTRTGLGARGEAGHSNGRGDDPNWRCAHLSYSRTGLGFAPPRRAVTPVYEPIHRTRTPAGQD